MREFGAVGWNISYDWMNSDLKAAMMQVKMYFEESPVISYWTLNVIIENSSFFFSLHKILLLFSNVVDKKLLLF